jgi:hypothetical protein
MKKKVCMIVMLCCMAGIAFSQGMGEIRGRVVDAGTNISIPGVNVYIKTGSNFHATVTDNNGDFVLKPLTPGTYNIEASHINYGKLQLVIDVYSDGIARAGTLKMTEGHTLVGPVITADPVIGYDAIPRMTQKDFEKISDGKNIINLIPLMTSDVQSTEDGEIYFRGARNNDFVYIIDGMVKHGGDANIPGIAIASMKVYTGGVPARYGDFTGGCIVIETQSYSNWVSSRGK